MTRLALFVLGALFVAAPFAAGIVLGSPQVVAIITVPVPVAAPCETPQGRGT